MDRKARLFSTRNIRTELADPAYKNGLLSVPDFIKAREFEIKSFELSQLKLKYAASNRVFQSLPRGMRRRTASHNVKRVPKRLRNRAIREMSDTNVVKSKSSGKQLYRLKMSKKLLKLASRIKLMKEIPRVEAGSVKAKIKLLSEQINAIKAEKKREGTVKLNNTLGSIDNTGIDQLANKPKGNVRYSQRQRQFVWLSTHVWHAKRFHMMKRWGYQIPLSPTQKCFRSVNRHSRNHTLISDTSYYDCCVIDYDSQMLTELTDVKISELNGFKTYNGWIYVKDMDTRIPVAKGLVYCAKELNKVLIRVHPSIYEELFSYLLDNYSHLQVQDCRYALGSLDILGPESLRTLNKIFHFGDTSSQLQELFKNLSQYNDSLPVGTAMALSIKDPRLWAYPTLPPIKTHMEYNDVIIALHQTPVEGKILNRLLTPEGRYDSYRDQLSTKQLNKGVDPEEVDNSIPVFLTKTRAGANSSGGHWTLILPWHWVLPVWIKLNRTSHVQLAGLKQLNQVNFENNHLSYPQDYPYLPEGWLNNELEIKLSQAKYNKLPKSKKQFTNCEHGLLPFGCDWEFLHKLYFLKTLIKGKLKQANEFSSFNPDNFLRDMNTVNDLVNNIDDMRDYKLCIELGTQAPGISSQTLVLHRLPRLPVRLIKVQMKQGSLKDGARIYLRDVNIENLIGFITSGGYNLNRGYCTGIGYIIAGTEFRETDLVIRNLGASKGYGVSLLKED